MAATSSGMATQGWAVSHQKADCGDIQDASSSAPDFTNLMPGITPTSLYSWEPQSAQK